MNLLSSVSQWEREIIGERTREAMAYLKEQQKVRSRPGFGYDIKRGVLTPNHKEHAILSASWRGARAGSRIKRSP